MKPFHFAWYALIPLLIWSACQGNAQKAAAPITEATVAIPAEESPIFPAPLGWVNDYEQILTAAERDELTTTLEEYERATTRQVVLVTVDRILPYADVQEYATDLGKSWGVGTAAANNGLTVVFCTSCRQVGIATGRSTEQILTDEVCKLVIDSSMIPFFREGDYFTGLRNGISELLSKWQ